MHELVINSHLRDHFLHYYSSQMEQNLKRTHETALQIKEIPLPLFEYYQLPFPELAFHQGYSLFLLIPELLSSAHDHSLRSASGECRSECCL